MRRATRTDSFRYAASRRAVRALLIGTLSLWLAAAAAHRAVAQPLVAPSEPLSAEEQRTKFRLPPGFEIQLVAAEPEIRKPINMNFDARGRLLVTQSTEYPFPAGPDSSPRDEVRMFSDFAPNGRARRVETFVDGLNIPIGVLALADSAIVYSIPNIYRMADTDGDGRADRRDLLYGTFEFRDTHGMASSFTRWVDGWVYACHGFANTSRVKGSDGGEVVMNSGNTYRFRADGARIEQLTWGQVNPFGLCFDPLGNVFTADCHSMPVYMLLRGAHYPSFGKPHDGLGFGPTMLSHQHGSTGICGVVFYAANHFPPKYRDTLFIGNPVTGRINHDQLQTRGSSYWCVEQPDFISCDDPWFRPVDIQLGPDGALYIADFYNRIIGHYEVPLTHPGRDRERGRIWRVVYRGTDGSVPPPAMPDVAAADVDRLIELLDDANLTVRVLATNELVDRVGAPAAEPAKRVLRNQGSAAHQRAHALWVVERVAGLDDELIQKLADDTDRLVRVHLVKALAERPEWSDSIARLVRAKLRDSNAFVRRAAADALARHPDQAHVAPLLELWADAPAEDTHLVHTARMALRDQLRRPGGYERLPVRPQADLDDRQRDRLRRLAEVSLGVHDGAAAAFVLDCLAAGFIEPGQVEAYLHFAVRYCDEPRLGETMALAMRLGQQSADPGYEAMLVRTLQRAAGERGKPLPPEVTAWAGRLCRDLLADENEGRVRLGVQLVRELRLVDLYDAVARLAAESRFDPVRHEAMDACVAIDGARAAAPLGAILGRGDLPIPLRQKAATALGTVQHDAAREQLLHRLTAAPQALAVTIAGSLAATPQGGELLLAAVTAGKASPALLREPGVVERLRGARLPDLDRRLEALTRDLAPADDRIAQLIAARREGFARGSHDPAAGQKIFEKHCAACHAIGGQGAKIGPELDGAGIRGLERLLEDILDPSRIVDQALRQTVISTTDGQILSGLVLRTEGKTIVMADSQGKEVRVSTDDVDQQAQSNLSPMPANVAELTTEQEFYQLLSYLLRQQTEKPADGAPADSSSDAAAQRFSAVARVVEAAIAERAFPGAVVEVGTSRQRLWSGAFGQLGYDRPFDKAVELETLYDLASLTKVVGTTSVVMALVREGKLALDDPLARHLPRFVDAAGDDEPQRTARRAVTIEHLLAHCSGLPAWRPLYRSHAGYADVLAAARAAPLEYEPGARTVYSDLGFMLLGEAASRAGGKPLAELERLLVFEPLALRTITRSTDMQLRPRTAPTETASGTTGADGPAFHHGVVHDENARAGDGLTGHAGLFGTAGDVGRLAAELLRALEGQSEIFPQPLARKFVARRTLVPGSSRALGWDTPSGSSSAGSLMSRRAFGHTGFTGTSVWIDPERDLYVVLLANRVHPTRENQKIHAVRRAVADAAVRAFDGAANDSHPDSRDP